MSVRTIKIVENLLAGNDQVAARNRQYFLDAGVVAVNVIAGPGAGKTSLISKTVQLLRGQAQIGVIEGGRPGVTSRTWMLVTAPSKSGVPEIHKSVRPSTLSTRRV